MISSFPNAKKYLQNIDLSQADKLDIMVKELLEDEVKYERASQALRRRFSRGAEIVGGIDRKERKTRIKRGGTLGNYKYLIEGENGQWSEPQERIWVVAMYALWQASKRK